jgi:hypothetical protein
MVCVVLAPPGLIAGPIPADSVSADGKRYELFVFEAGDDRRWTTARAFALGRGGTLVNITSPAENQLLVGAFTDAMAGRPHPFAWIGGTDEASEQTWLWRDGDEAGLVFWIGPPGAGSVPGVYSNWYQSEPNNWGPDNYNAILLGVFASLQPGHWIDSPDNPPLASDPIGGFVVESGICAADLAPPFDLLDLSDINAFVIGFLAEDPVSDLATPLGVWDLEDVALFVQSFVLGCP